MKTDKITNVETEGDRVLNPVGCLQREWRIWFLMHNFHPWFQSSGKWEIFFFLMFAGGEIIDRRRWNIKHTRIQVQLCLLHPQEGRWKPNISEKSRQLSGVNELWKENRALLDTKKSFFYYCKHKTRFFSGQRNQTLHVLVTDPPLCPQICCQLHLSRIQGPFLLRDALHNILVTSHMGDFDMAY